MISKGLFRDLEEEPLYIQQFEKAWAVTGAKGFKRGYLGGEARPV